MQTVERILGWGANLIQVGSFLVVLYLLWRNSRRLAQRLRELERRVSARPVALAIGLGGGIEGQVRSYLAAQNLEMAVEPYAREGKVPVEQFPSILRDLQKIKDKLTEQGVTEVHLFYKGPVSLAVAIGAITRNWVPVKVYNFEAEGYQQHLVLYKEAVIGAEDRLAQLAGR